MAFTGTLDKCKACDKTVYFVDLLSADGATFHKSCFKCSHCKGTLVMSNYSSMDGVLYCKTHFEQLFKESGNFSKNFQTASKPERENSLTRAPSKLSALFSGTQDKCAACNKTVYPLEKVTMEGEAFHKSCFKCAHGGCPLTHATYAALDGVLYCKHHFAQLFMEKGNYQHVLEAANNKKNSAEKADDEQETTEKAEDEQPQDKEPDDNNEQPIIEEF
ncbi:LIM domain-containing protein PLIM2c-like isoform X1 [Nicotiana tomentosiformis]|uniref:LIM domain-containing protein PLIM2c-like isoform X2 n=1 Tax=Nicotiana tabacum TaxID=4097 RepID=A0A1S3Z1B6_TOBAC|nr:LIM domain-containing protein PLIM2c-like isoform X2 [Nicotiana tomentosiformis]XP_016458234.1 PREDICTED: LIM domain-containing protein PLIM2c-like isoform X2 [Nicotiana tabacum]